MYDYWLSFLAGFFASVHCVGMCGPIVLGYSTQGTQTSLLNPYSLSSHFLYNSGRILSYACIGGIAGLLGGGVSGLRGFESWFSGVLGVLVVAMGISLFGTRGTILSFHWLDSATGIGKLLQRLYQATFGSLIHQGGLESRFYLGFITPLLPCGLLYGMFLQAAGTESLVSGSLTMLTFGLGIVPAMFTTGVASSFLGFRLRRWANKLAAATLLLMGFSLVWRAVVSAPHSMH